MTLVSYLVQINFLRKEKEKPMEMTAKKVGLQSNSCKLKYEATRVRHMKEKGLLPG